MKEWPWSKQREVAIDGDELPDKYFAPRTMAFRVDGDRREDSWYELHYWREWASNEIKATGGNPTIYKLMAGDYENAQRLFESLGWQSSNRHKLKTVGNLQRRHVAACLLVQLDRIGFCLERLDRCEMTEEAHQLGHLVVAEALTTLRDLRELMILRNEKAIVSSTQLWQNRADKRDSRKRIDDQLLKDARHLMQRHPQNKTNYSWMARQLMNVHRGYKYDTLRKKLKGLISEK
jgi:hypothetical protein